MFDRVSQHLKSRSAALLLTIDNRLDRILQGWLLLAGLLSAAAKCVVGAGAIWLMTDSSQNINLVSRLENST